MQESIVVGVSGVGFGCASNATIDAQMKNACVGDDENNDGDELESVFDCYPQRRQS